MQKEPGNGAQGVELGEFGIALVAAGTAGCLLANLLSADPGVSAVLREPGGGENSLWISVLVGCLWRIGNRRTGVCFLTEAEAGLNGRSIRDPRSNVRGGWLAARQAALRAGCVSRNDAMRCSSAADSTRMLGK